MEELQIFNGKDFVGIPQKAQFEYLGWISYVLYLACDAADTGDYTLAWEYLKKASLLGHPHDSEVFNQLYATIAMSISMEEDKSELYYQHLFKRFIGEIFPGAEVVKIQTNGKDIPDAWCRLNEKLFPVEIKLHSFDTKALNQLQRYMTVYNCEEGIAVGKDLTVSLPQGIQFVKLSVLDACERYYSKDPQKVDLSKIGPRFLRRALNDEILYKRKDGTE